MNKEPSLQCCVCVHDHRLATNPARTQNLAPRTYLPGTLYFLPNNFSTFQLFCFRGTRPPALAGNNREADLMNSEAFFRSLFCGSSIFVHPSSFFVLCSLFFVGAGRGGEERLSEPCSKADSLVVVCCCGTNQRSTHHSLTTHHSPLTTHHSPLTTHHSPPLHLLE